MLSFSNCFLPPNVLRCWAQIHSRKRRLSSRTQRLWKEGDWGAHILRRFEPIFIRKSGLGIYVLGRHLIANIVLQWD